MKSGQPIFSLDSSEQQAAVDTARRRLVEIDAAATAATAELAASEARILEAQSALDQSTQELNTRLELQQRHSASVSPREIERLQILVSGRQAAVATAVANKNMISAQISAVLPAQKASAEAQLAEAQVDLDKTIVRAGVDGTLEQFTLRRGDIVNPLMRPAGVLIPTEAGRWGLIAGFNQLEAQVIRVGMLAEVACISKPMTVIPMVVTDVQALIATGQLRASDQLIDAQQVAVPGTLTAYLEPLFEGGFDEIPPGSKCLANAYTNNHERLANENLGTMTRLYLHMIDTVGVVHAIVLRIHALLLPVQTLVFSGGH